MAVESRIDADDQWFVGEDRTLRFELIDGDVGDVDEWTLAFTLYPRRAGSDAAPLISASGIGFAATLTARAYVAVAIDGDATAGLAPGIYQFVLARTDSGARAILSYGPAELRRALNA